MADLVFEVIQEADVRVDNIYLTPRYNHNAIEPHATIAFWNDDVSLVVLVSSQSVNTIAHTLALLLTLEPSGVPVLSPFVGGCFV